MKAILLAISAAIFVSLAPGLARPEAGRSDEVQSLVTQGRYPEAEARARRRLAEEERRSGPRSLQVAKAIDALVLVLPRTGKSAQPDSRSLGERAVLIKKEVLGVRDFEYGLSLRNLGILLTAAGQYSEARPLLEQAKSILESHRGSKDPEVATDLLWLGVLNLQVGKPSIAEGYSREALAIRSARFGRRSPSAAEAINALATTFYELGRFSDAAPLFEEAAANWSKSFGPNHPQVATSRHNLGALYSELGDDEDARPQLEEALRIRRLRLGADHPLVASTLTVLAETLDALGETGAARSRYEEALRIYRTRFGSSSDKVGWTLMKLGLLDLKHGDLTNAKRWLRDALRVQEETLGKEHMDLGWTLGGLARISAAEGDTASAGAMYRRAIAIQEKALGPMHPDVGLNLSQYASFLEKAGQPRQAFLVAMRATGIGERQLRVTAEGSAERQSLTYAGSRKYGLDVALSLVGTSGVQAIQGSVSGVWDALIRTRTLVLDEVAIRQRLAGAQRLDPGLADATRALDLARERVANLTVRGDLVQLRDAEDEMDRAERQLAVRSSVFRGHQTQDRIGFQDIVSALPERSTLVAFASSGSAEAEGEYVAFVLEADRPPRVSVLKPIGQVDALVARWVSDISRPEPQIPAAAARVVAEERASGTELRKAIWDPLRLQLGNVERVFVVPEGSLYRVGFAALPSSGSGYLIEAAPAIHYLSSERDLITLPRRHTADGGLLALGGPSFDARPDNAVAPRDAASPTRGAAAMSQPEPDCSGFRSVSFPPLPESAAEARDIASMWANPQRVLLLTGEKATESALKRGSPKCRVLHLATHGFFLDAHCTSTETTGRGIGGISTSRGSQQVKPLLLSGLALAGANQRNNAPPGKDDGILTAQEIASLDLSSVNLAVLSACDTGIGKIQGGEGVLGLRRAFQIAGVRSTVMSLWGVEDQSTRIWMEAFYRGILRGELTVAEAARNASLGLLRSRRAQGRSTSPYYWAGFIVAGDWR